MCKGGTEGMTVSKDQIRRTLLTAEVVEHVRLGSEGLHIPPCRLQKEVAPASLQLFLGSGMDETTPSGPPALCSFTE